MRTTLDLDPKLVEEAMSAVGVSTKSTAVRLGLEALIQRAAERRLAALYGRIPELKLAPRRRPAPAKNVP